MDSVFSHETPKIKSMLLFAYGLSKPIFASSFSPIDTAIYLKKEHLEPHNAEQESVGTSFCRISSFFKVLVANRLQ